MTHLVQDHLRGDPQDLNRLPLSRNTGNALCFIDHVTTSSGCANLVLVRPGSSGSELSVLGCQADVIA